MLKLMEKIFEDKQTGKISCVIISKSTRDSIVMIVSAVSMNIILRIDQKVQKESRTVNVSTHI